jgi:hypothetical protein
MSGSGCPYLLVLHLTSYILAHYRLDLPELGGVTLYSLFLNIVSPDHLHRFLFDRPEGMWI